MDAGESILGSCEDCCGCVKAAYPTHITGDFSWEYNGYRPNEDPAFAYTESLSGSGTFDQNLTAPIGSNPPTPGGGGTLLTTAGTTTINCTPDVGDPVAFTLCSPEEDCGSPDAPSPNIGFQVFCQGDPNRNQNDPDPSHQGWLMAFSIGSPVLCIGQISFVSEGDYFGIPGGYSTFFNYDGPLGTFSLEGVLDGGADFGTGSFTINFTLT